MARRIKPKGVHTKPTASWFSERCAYAGGFIGAGGLGVIHIALMNNSVDNYLHVYGIDLWIQVDHGWNIAPRPSPGSYVPNLGPPDNTSVVVQGGAAVAGIIGTEFTTSSYAAFGPGYNVQSPGLTWQWPHDFPFAILPPNTALDVSSSDAAVGMSAAFWYLMSPDPQ